MSKHVKYLAVAAILAATAFVFGNGREAHAIVDFGCPETTAFVTCVPIVEDPDLTVVEKTWSDIPTDASDNHFIFLDGIDSTHIFFETVINDTGAAMTDYHIVFGNESPFVVDAFSLDVSADIDVFAGDVASSHSGGVATGPFDCVFFSSPPPFGAFCSFSIVFDTAIPDGAGFTVDAALSSVPFGFLTIEQFPTATAFDPVPEPGVLALFGLGLAGLGFMRRRRTA